MKSLYFCFIGLSVLFAACQKQVPSPQRRLPDLPDQAYSYNTPPSASFFNPFGDSSIDNDIATLGRVLFYDTQLSQNNSVSCGSCHQQINGFADPRNFSFGFENVLTERNTQTIVNTGTQTGFFWDLREKTLDHMVLQPIANHVEMGLTDTLELELRVSSLDYYNSLFEKAFGSTTISTQRIGIALAQFIKSIISVSSRYDEGRILTQDNRVDFPNFNEQENLGRHLFFSKFPCSQCHGGVNLDGSLSAPKNIGLDKDYLDNGMVGFLESGMARDGFFKTPSLRNIALTSPYMHDGRFKTLEDVIEFYNSGIRPHPQLSEELRIREQGGLSPEHLGPVINFDFIPEPVTGAIPQRMFMTGQEKAALVAFLKTLTDYTVITDPKFSDPFEIVGTDN
jgi:cytochrome c peroxidase